MSTPSSARASEQDSAVIARLLGHTPDSIVPYPGGGNNRVFRVEHGGRSLLAKQYFTDASDMRDRLGSEWDFLSYARKIGVDNVPQPVACDRDAHVALFTFLQGDKPQRITADMVRQAGRLIRELNRRNEESQALSLPLASESCFTAADNIAMLSQRLQTLQQEAVQPTADFSALMERMEALAARHTRALLDGYAALGIAPDAPLPQQARCLSPSDFGFHNSLLLPSGRLQFIDFEYAGWDDPAKMLCDFFLHPGMAVDPAWVGIFWEEIRNMPPGEHTPARTALLYPLFALRWSCIILNVFVPRWAARRAFADPAWDVRAAQQQQLEKARQMLHRIERNPFEDMT